MKATCQIQSKTKTFKGAHKEFRILVSRCSKSVNGAWWIEQAELYLSVTSRFIWIFSDGVGKPFAGWFLTVLKRWGDKMRYDCGGRSFLWCILHSLRVSLQTLNMKMCFPSDLVYQWFIFRFLAIVLKVVFFLVHSRGLHLTTFSNSITEIFIIVLRHSFIYTDTVIRTSSVNTCAFVNLNRTYKLWEPIFCRIFRHLRWRDIQRWLHYGWLKG